jgi:hypothetical protein
MAKEEGRNEMRGANSLRAALALLVVAALSSCGGSSSPTAQSTQALNQPMGTVAVIGTDDPVTLSSVLAFQVTIAGLTVSDGTKNTNLITLSQPIEFSRLNGLKTLLDVNAVPANTYTSATVTLATPTISFLDSSVNPPKVSTMNGKLTQSSVTIPLNPPLVVSQTELVGLLFDFKLASSLEVVNGQLDGNVNPQLSLKAIPADAPQAFIDELRGGVVSVNGAGGSFVMQGPHGRQITVLTNGNTEFESGDAISSFDTSTVVEVSGNLDRASLTLHATDVDVVSRDHFVLGGLITDARPSPGPASQMDVLVRSELPDLSTAPIGEISTLALNGTELYPIRRLRLPIASLLFNRASLVRGQQVAVGGQVGAANALNVRRVVLEPQGLVGSWQPGSTDAGSGTFLFNSDGIAGILFGQPVKVFATPLTRFVGLGGLGGLSGTQPIRLRVVGLVLLDHISGRPVIVAGLIETFPPPDNE